MPTVNLTTFGRNVKKERTRLGLSQEDLAARAGISVVHLSRLERGINDARLSTFLSLVDALETSPATLLQGLAEPTR